MNTTNSDYAHLDIAGDHKIGKWFGRGGWRSRAGKAVQ